MVNELLERKRHVVVLCDLNDGAHAATTEKVGTEGERANESGGALNLALPRVAAVTVA
jgi:hypothetical protein